MVRQKNGPKDLGPSESKPLVSVSATLKRAADFAAVVGFKGFLLESMKSLDQMRIEDGQTVRVKSKFDVEYEILFELAGRKLTIACANDLQIIYLKEGEKVEVALDMFGVSRGEIEFRAITSPK
ncbi:MAG: hypothetical protein AB1529_03300 [Candidatus Micrarchaeota archaeon]